MLKSQFLDAILKAINCGELEISSLARVVLLESLAFPRESQCNNCGRDFTTWHDYYPNDESSNLAVGLLFCRDKCATDFRGRKNNERLRKAKNRRLNRRKKERELTTEVMKVMGKIENNGETENAT